MNISKEFRETMSEFGKLSWQTRKKTQGAEYFRGLQKKSAKKRRQNKGKKLSTGLS